MRIFLSWSGHRSCEVARLLESWIPQVLQAVSIFFSEELEKGVLWSSKIAAELRAADFGIICITPENVSEPWLNFEAGALIARLERKMTPLLLGIDKTDLAGPLAQYNLTQATHDDIFRLIATLNTGIEDPLTEARLHNAFSHFWPELERGLTKVLSRVSKPEIARSLDNKVDEVLGLLRAQTAILDTEAKYTQLMEEYSPRDAIDRLRSDPPSELEGLSEREWYIARELALGKSIPTIAASFGVRDARIRSIALRTAKRLGLTGVRSLAKRIAELSAAGSATH